MTHTEEATEHTLISDGSDIIFCSYCFGTQYEEQQRRLLSSILAIYPNANTHFLNEDESTGKPRFQQSLYGFKVGLVRDCLARGFRKIIFFDTAITLVSAVDHWFTLTPEHGVLAAIDRQTLERVTSDACLSYCGLTREQVSTWTLLGGSIYVFDFSIEKCRAIFAMWEKMERDGIFGTQDDLSHDRLQSHRMDETCMALAMKLTVGTVPLGHDVMRYGYIHPETGSLHASIPETELIVKKLHFK